MYSTCLFCNGTLGSNQAVEHFPVGRRLAFDAAKGRLWVVCALCGRWNLSPIEERWEAIDECERAFRGTRLRVSTGNIGLARLRDGTELVRIGAPLRPEFAAWRYGEKLGQRRRRSELIAAGGVAATILAGAALGPTLAPAMALGAISIVVIPGITTVMGVIPMVGIVAARDYLQHERVVAMVPRGRALLTVREKHVRDAVLHVDDAGDAIFDLPHDTGRVQFDGTAAIHTARVVVASSNRFGARRGRVRDAVAHIEEQGDAAGYLARVSRLGNARVRIMSVVNGWRHIGALHLSPTERLALEMAMNEETERRVLEGELEVLADAWREAEQIAQIADGLLAPELPGE